MRSRILQSAHLRQPLLLSALSAWLAIGCATTSIAPPLTVGHTQRLALDTLAPGLVYARYAGTQEPLRIHVVTVDIDRPELYIESARARGRQSGRETTTAISLRRAASRDPVVVALNADFFDLETGEVENNHVIGGDVVRGTPITDSPHDTFNNIHSQLAITRDGRPLIERFRFDGRVMPPGGRAFRLHRVNSEGDSGEIVLYTPHFDAPVPAGRDDVMFVLRRIDTRGDTAIHVARRETRGTPMHVPAGGAVLVASAAPGRELARTVDAADTIRIVFGFQPDHGPLRTLIGGWPRIIRHGDNVATSADSVEGTFPRFSAARHPRSAVGWSPDSTQLFLVAVDGRQESSVGMSLDELGDFMLGLGVFDALNLDGGGSTTLVIRGRLVTSPSDEDGERPVGNALLVHRREQ